MVVRRAWRAAGDAQPYTCCCGGERELHDCVRAQRGGGSACPAPTPDAPNDDGGAMAEPYILGLVCFKGRADGSRFSGAVVRRRGAPRPPWPHCGRSVPQPTSRIVALKTRFGQRWTAVVTRSAGLRGVG